MRRLSVNLSEIAERKNVVLAFQKAAKGKRNRDSVRQFQQDFDQNVNQLCQDILSAKLPYGRFRVFQIHDPKKRLIHAACFEDRIFHHAFINVAGDELERRMQSTSYACRKNKGVHKAAKVVQKNLQKYPYFVKIDIDGYFPSIRHECLLNLLARCFKGQEGVEQLTRIIKCHESKEGYGLPIGSLTSQYFANYYLNGLDCFLAEHSDVVSNVRYMDDVIWWCKSRAEAKNTLEEARDWLQKERELTVKPTVQILASTQGVTYCGFRILQGAIRLSRRRKRRYQERRLYWEKQYRDGKITSLELQQAYAAVHSVTEMTDSLSWRRENLKRHPSIGV